MVIQKKILLSESEIKSDPEGIYHDIRFTIPGNKSFQFMQVF